MVKEAKNKSRKIVGTHTGTGRCEQTIFSIFQANDDDNDIHTHIFHRRKLIDGILCKCLTSSHDIPMIVYIRITFPYICYRRRCRRLSLSYFFASMTTCFVLFSIMNSTCSIIENFPLKKKSLRASSHLYTDDDRKLKTGGYLHERRMKMKISNDKMQFTNFSLSQFMLKA